MSRYRDYEIRSEELIRPITDAEGLELVDVEFVKEGSNLYLRAYIDKPGGVTIDDCEKVSRAFSVLLDEKDYIEEAYILEVSSPGLGRPLKKDRDFDRNLGKEIEIKTFKPVDGRREFEGTLKLYDEKTFTITDEDGQEVVFERKQASVVREKIDW